MSGATSDIGVFGGRCRDAWRARAGRTRTRPCGRRARGGSREERALERVLVAVEGGGVGAEDGVQMRDELRVGRRARGLRRWRAGEQRRAERVTRVGETVAQAVARPQRHRGERAPRGRATRAVGERDEDREPRVSAHDVSHDHRGEPDGDGATAAASSTAIGAEQSTPPDDALARTLRVAEDPPVSHQPAHAPAVFTRAELRAPQRASQLGFVRDEPPGEPTVTVGCGQQSRGGARGRDPAARGAGNYEVILGG